MFRKLKYYITKGYIDGGYVKPITGAWPGDRFFMLLTVPALGAGDFCTRIAHQSRGTFS